MVNCRKFKQWLLNQDASDENVLRQVKAHIQVCQVCEAQYQTDTALDEMLKKGMQTVDPPAGLIMRARRRIESEPRPRRFNFPGVSWKTAVPVLSMAVLVLVMFLTPFSRHPQTVDEVVANSIANHLDTSMKMTFRAAEVVDIGQWFTRRLGYTVRLPDLEKLGLKVIGGRECALGDINAALLFCVSSGKRASLFVIDQNDVDVYFDKGRKYTVEDGDLKVTIWKEAQMVYAIVI